jgi:hypothetical protein
MSKPNIFNYATSELSQDAIICYILEWAKIENKAISENLYNLGIKFINSLFDNFQKIDKPDIYHKIEIKKQYKNIDILCIVNDEYSIIIEDKTNTKNHSDQLKRYFDEIKKDFSNTKILPIYFKTGDQSNYDNVKENGYSIYGRKDFLNVLNDENYKNDVIENYTDYLQNIENSINSYKITPIEDWSWNAWKGFYIELKDKLNDGNWDYVSNRQGGFLGFWWNWNDTETYHIYLQIETSWEKNKYIGKIKIKLYSKDNNKVDKTIVNKWKSHILHNDNNIKISKPRVVRTGKSVTVGILENEFRISDNDNLIDMNKTIEFIKLIEDIKIDKLTRA